jgi:tetratricopeptide (TPR) repeat protein
VKRLVFVVCLAACGATPREVERAVDRQKSAAERHAAAWEAARRAWQKRTDEAALREAIARWKDAVALRDDDHEAYTMLARAYFFLADGFIVTDGKRADELPDAFEQGLINADRGLRALSPQYEQRRQGGQSADEAIAGLGREAAPLLYWYALNLIRWAHVEGTFTVMKEYKRSHRIMHAVERLDPDYYYGGADRYFGMFLAGAPGIAGGDVNEAKVRFQAALRRAPAFFETHLLYAELYAVKVGDKQLYVSSLRYILDTPAEILPEVAPEQLRTKVKAASLIKRTDERFGP